MKNFNQKFVYKVFLFLTSFILLGGILFLFFGKNTNQTFTGKFDFEDSYKTTISENTKLTLFQELNKTQIPSKPIYQTKDYIYFQVSKTNSLGQYAPDDLVTLQSQYVTKPTQVSKLIEDDLIKLLDKAKADGVDIKVTSGYRSYSAQEALFNLYISQERKNHPDYTQEQLVATVNQYSAIPGHSEHQLGTTVDLVSSENGYQLIADDTLKYVQWIAANASNFNFRISYPKGNTEYIYEPWHLRWWPKV